MRIVRISFCISSGILQVKHLSSNQVVVLLLDWLYISPVQCCFHTPLSLLWCYLCKDLPSLTWFGFYQWSRDPSGREGSSYWETQLETADSLTGWHCHTVLQPARKPTSKISSQKESQLWDKPHLIFASQRWNTQEFVKELTFLTWKH